MTVPTLQSCFQEAMHREVENGEQSKDVGHEGQLWWLLVKGLK